MATLATNLVPKVPLKYNCELCDYNTSRNSQYARHLTTSKHTKLVKHNKNEQKSSADICCVNCNKKYKDRSGLWKHKKICKKEHITNDTSMTFLTNLVLEVVKNNADLQKQNQELQMKMLEVCQTNTVINNNNSHNKTFNLQFFLNEQCKDAMNIMDFVDTFKLDFADLDNVGKLGYVEGISNIIIQKLNEMDIYKRPIHCSDLKRETTHVKDKGVWEKDNGNHDKLRLAIQHVTHKNIKLLNPWIEAHPQAQASAHYLNNVYMNYIMQSMGGKGDLDDNESKIIKKIAKVILIDK